MTSYHYYIVDGIMYAVCLLGAPANLDGSKIAAVLFRKPSGKEVKGRLHHLPVMGLDAYRLDEVLDHVKVNGRWETEPGEQRPLDGEVVGGAEPQPQLWAPDAFSFYSRGDIMLAVSNGKAGFCTFTGRPLYRLVFVDAPFQPDVPLEERAKGPIVVADLQPRKAFFKPYWRLARPIESMPVAGTVGFYPVKGVDA